MPRSLVEPALRPPQGCHSHDRGNFTLFANVAVASPSTDKLTQGQKLLLSIADTTSSCFFLLQTFLFTHQFLAQLCVHYMSESQS